MAKHRVMHWACTRCNNKIKSKIKPAQCPKCKLFGTYVFHGAKLIKGDQREGKKVVQHLGTLEEFQAFCNEMWQQMQKHKRDDNSMKYMDPVNVYSIGLIEVKKRLAKMLIQDPKEIIKQDVHCANYLFFMWVKMKEMLKEQNK